MVSLFWTLALLPKLFSIPILKTLYWFLPGLKPNSNSILPTVLFILAILMKLALHLTALDTAPAPMSSNQLGFATGHPHKTGLSCLLSFFWNVLLVSLLMVLQL